MAFIFARDRMRPFSRGNFYGRILCCSDWGGGGYADAAILAGQGFFDGDGTVRRQVHIVRIVIAYAAVLIALPVAGNIDISADGYGTSVNVNTAAAACGMVPGDAAAVHGEIRSFAAHMHSTAICIGIVPGDVTAVHGEGRVCMHIHSATIYAISVRIIITILGNASAIHGKTCLILQIHPTNLILGNTAVVHDETMVYICAATTQNYTASITGTVRCMSNRTCAYTVTESKGDTAVRKHLNYVEFVTCNFMAIKAEGNVALNLNTLIQCKVVVKIVGSL